MIAGEFREKAVEALAQAVDYPLLSPARAALMAEAQVYATLGGPVPEVVEVVVEAPPAPAPTEARPPARRAAKKTASPKEGEK